MSFDLPSDGRKQLLTGMLAGGVNCDGLHCLVLVVAVGRLAANSEVEQHAHWCDPEYQENINWDAVVACFCANTVF